MDWLFPSLKASLFPTKSTSAIPVDSPAASNSPEAKTAADSAAAHTTEAQDPVAPLSVDYKAMIEDTDSPIHSKPSHQLRRRSSLSDLDSFLRKERIIRSSDLLTIGEYHGPSNKRGDRNGRVWSLLLDGQQQQPLLEPWTRGGSIGDMINLKLYGSNRSLMSGTSSIAETVPLETIQRKKTTPSVVSSTNSDDVFRHQRLASSAQEDMGPISHHDIMMDGRLSNGDYEDDPFYVGCGSGDVIEEEDEREELENDALCELRTGRRPRRTRPPSITERTERLSILIRKRQRRCSRYAEDIAVKLTKKTNFVNMLNYNPRYSYSNRSRLLSTC